MIAVNLDHITLTYQIEPLFEDLSWEIHDGRCVGFIGPNGAGKSSLLKLIIGEVSADSGSIVRRRGLTIGYLQQEPRLDPGNTLFKEALSASNELNIVEIELTRIENQLNDPKVYGDEAVLSQTLEKQARLLEEYSLLGGPSYQNRVRSTLISLGFGQSDLDQPVSVLSGGQKKLLGLAKLIITAPDLLLLDEPDNHLDLDGKKFLEQIIRDYKGGIIIVSHDRYLLDLVVDEIVELEDGRLTRYPGTYSEYAYEKQLLLHRQEQLFKAQEKEINRLETAAKRLLTWGKVYDNQKFIKRGQNILKRIDRIERIDQPTLERKQMGLELSGWRGSNKVLEIIDLDKVFPAEDGKEADKILFAGLNLQIWHGDRVGLVGPNGAGKSLLLKMILGEQPATGGEIILGPSVEAGYYAQEHETLDYKRTLLDSVRYATECSESNAVALLGRFLFTYEQVREPIASLSGGERSRLQMLLLTLSGPNFLLLDEPTNNLDIPSAEVLENALDDFEGTMLVISHDRYFLDRVVT
ncbi:MAG: ribosomal protection-like ABC-F family protein, partial [Anaerolineales bacterium]